jgi:transcriptional regulator GlxA family with amidase domain
MLTETMLAKMTISGYFLPMTKTLNIVVFAFDGCQLMDVAGPSAVFGVANSTVSEAVYEVKVVSPYGGLVRTTCGVSIATLAPKTVSPRTVDTILVAGGSTSAMSSSIAVSGSREWLKRCFKAASRFGSICSGTNILARLGQLGNMRVATHWASCDNLAREFPALSIDRNSLYVVSGKIWTSAGVSTGIDMALAMVERDISRLVADKIAKFMVLYGRRSGYQSQFSETLNAQIDAGAPFSGLLTWLESHISHSIPIASLADRCGLSERTFYRRFVSTTGRTPAQFIQNMRLDRARTLLATDLSLKIIARRTGMGSPARLSLAFKRKFGLSPSTFRKLHHSDK